MMMVIRSRKPSSLMRRNIRREKISLIRKIFNATIVRSLVTLLLVVDQTRKEEEANIARGESDDELVLLMASESYGGYFVDWWYRDTDCLNHLT